MGVPYLPVQYPPRRRKALVVDDDAMMRALVAAQLQREGYQVALAADGAEAVRLASVELPDIVFMDVMMPVLSGFEATERIKGLAPDRFVPVILLTALDEEEALAPGVECGADDFLHKPVRPEVLRAKITTFERIGDLYRVTYNQRATIEQFNSRLMREQEIAEQIFSRVVASRNVALSAINTLLLSAATFNGDVLLTAHRPDGGLNVLLGDCTGHGLTAAIGAVPVSEVFHAMTAKGMGADAILLEINRKLCHLMPTGMFMAACFVSVDPSLDKATVWNGGMPDVLVLTKDAVRARLASQSLALGIIPELEVAEAVQVIAISPGDRIALCSDGLTEVRSGDGEQFGQQRYEDLLTSHQAEQVVPAIVNALRAFNQDHPYEDDVSLVDIPCSAAVLRYPGD